MVTALRVVRLDVPVEVGPDVGAAAAASPADEPLLEIGQPNIVRPSITGNRGGVAAMVVGAIDQNAADA